MDIDSADPSNAEGEMTRKTFRKELEKLDKKLEALETFLINKRKERAAATAGIADVYDKAVFQEYDIEKLDEGFEYAQGILEKAQGDILSYTQFIMSAVPPEIKPFDGDPNEVLKEGKPQDKPEQTPTDDKVTEGEGGKQEKVTEFVFIKGDANDN